MSEEEQFNEDEELDLSTFLMMNSSNRCTMIFMMV